MRERSQFEEDIEGEVNDDLCLTCDQPFDFCECDEGAECGRWDNGRLTHLCSKAGSEECDFECPYRESLYK